MKVVARGAKAGRGQKDNGATLGFEAIRKLMEPPEKTKGRIGFWRTRD